MTITSKPLLVVMILLVSANSRISLFAESKGVSQRPMSACHIEQFGAYNALREISQKAGVPIGVDAVEPVHESTIVFDFPGGTVADLLNMFISGAPGYQWKEDPNGVIHVWRNDAEVTLLDVNILFPTTSVTTRERLWRDISKIPEVAGWLASNHCSRDDFQTGNPFTAHNDPISLEQGSVSVRQLLDEIALKSGENYWAVLKSPSGRPCHISLLF